MVVRPEGHSNHQPVMPPQLGRTDICSEGKAKHNSKHPPTGTGTQIQIDGLHTLIQCTDSKPIPSFNEHSYTSTLVAVNIKMQTNIQAAVACMMQMLCSEYHSLFTITQFHTITPDCPLN